MSAPKLPPPLVFSGLIDGIYVSSADGKTWTASKDGLSATADRLGDAFAELSRLRAEKASQ